MSLQDRIPQALQQFSNNLAAAHQTGLVDRLSEIIEDTNQKLQQHMIDQAANIQPPAPMHFGTLDLNKLVPDISLNLSHLRALLSSAFQQLECLNATRKQIDAACWLISDALKELSVVESIYYAEPETPDPAA